MAPGGGGGGGGTAISNFSTLSLLDIDAGQCAADAGDLVPQHQVRRRRHPVSRPALQVEHHHASGGRIRNLHVAWFVSARSRSPAGRTSQIPASRRVRPWPSRLICALFWRTMRLPSESCLDDVGNGFGGIRRTRHGLGIERDRVRHELDVHWRGVGDRIGHRLLRAHGERACQKHQHEDGISKNHRDLQG